MTAQEIKNIPLDMETVFNDLKAYCCMLRAMEVYSAHSAQAGEYEETDCIYADMILRGFVQQKVQEMSVLMNGFFKYYHNILDCNSTVNFDSLAS